MRVALVASSLRLAGAEKQFVYMARALHESGVDTRVYYLGAGDYYQSVLTRAGINVRQIFKKNRPLLMLASLAKELLQFKPQVVLAGQFGDLIFAGPAGRCCRALVLGGVRSDGFYELNTYARRKDVMLRLAHGLIANSVRARTNLASKGVNANKIAVLPNIIDLSDFDARASIPLSNHLLPGRPLIVAVGSLIPCKRFDRFLEALALARRKQPQIFGVIAGDDLGSKAGLIEQAKALGLWPEHVCFLGECAEIPALLKRCRLLVLTSEYEGFPNVILEAMAARLPAVTTPVGDAALIVADGVTGYVVPENDRVQMAERMAQLIENPAMASEFGARGRKRVEENYDFDSLSERLLGIFRRFASEQRRNWADWPSLATSSVFSVQYSVSSIQSERRQPEPLNTEY